MATLYRLLSLILGISLCNSAVAADDQLKGTWRLTLECDAAADQSRVLFEFDPIPIKNGTADRVEVRRSNPDRTFVFERNITVDKEAIDIELRQTRQGLQNYAWKYGFKAKRAEFGQASIAGQQTSDNGLARPCRIYAVAAGSAANAVAVQSPPAPPAWLPPPLSAPAPTILETAPGTTRISPGATSSQVAAVPVPAPKITAVPPPVSVRSETSLTINPTPSPAVGIIPSCFDLAIAYNVRQVSEVERYLKIALNTMPVDQLESLVSDEKACIDQLNRQSDTISWQANGSLRELRTFLLEKLNNRVAQAQQVEASTKIGPILDIVTRGIPACDNEETIDALKKTFEDSPAGRTQGLRLVDIDEITDITQHTLVNAYSQNPNITSDNFGNMRDCVATFITNGGDRMGSFQIKKKSDRYLYSVHFFN